MVSFHIANRYRSYSMSVLFFRRMSPSMGKRSRAIDVTCSPHTYHMRVVVWANGQFCILRARVNGIFKGFREDHFVVLVCNIRSRFIGYKFDARRMGIHRRGHPYERRVLVLHGREVRSLFVFFHFEGERVRSGNIGTSLVEDSRGLSYEGCSSFFHARQGLFSHRFFHEQHRSREYVSNVVSWDSFLYGGEDYLPMGVFRNVSQASTRVNDRLPINYRTYAHLFVNEFYGGDNRK